MDPNTVAETVAATPYGYAIAMIGIYQGKASANCIYAVGKQEPLSGKLIIYPAMIEFYAILGLIISIILVAPFIA